MSSKNKAPLLEQGLIAAMQSIDQHVSRAMERSPADREKEGVQKWGPYGQKIEQICSLVMQGVGDDEIHLDSLIVLSQAMVKCLKLVVHDLGSEGLGELRSRYCIAAFEEIDKDAASGLKEIRDPGGAGFLT